MKIFYASQSFYPHIGGVSTYLLNLQKQIKNYGHTVTELHLRPSFASNTDNVEGIEVLRVPKEPLDKDMLKGYSKFKEAIYKECHNIKGSFNYLASDMQGYDEFLQINDAFGEGVREVLNVNPPDIIHIHDFQLIYLYRYVPRGLPLVFTWHIPLYKTISPHLKRFLLNHLINYDVIVFSSQDYIKAAVDMGLPRKKCKMIYPICNTGLFKPIEVDKDTVCRKYKIPTGKKIILCVQRIDPKSGHMQLIDSMPQILKKIPDALLVFVGGDSMSNKISDDRLKYKESVHSRIKQLGLEEKVIFTGNIDYHELPELYNSSDLIALCSKQEGFGLSVTEGMSCAKPIIGTKVGGIPIQVKNNKNGYLVDVDDIRKTASCCIKILKDERIRNEFGNNSYGYVKKRFSLEIGVEKHLVMYSQVFKEKGLLRNSLIDLSAMNALVTDYDRTLTDKPGELKDETIAALEKLDLIHILATGRSLEYVKGLSDKYDLWDIIVCENGSIIYFPNSKKEIICDSSYQQQARAILKNSDIPCSFGKVIISVDKIHLQKVKMLLGDMIHDLNIVFNVNEFMILPKFINKGEGLKLALHMKDIDPEKIMIVGDGENDKSMYLGPGLKISLANSHPRLKQISDLNMKGASSEGIMALVSKVLNMDL